MFNTLKDIDQETIDSIQWDMTPEEAIALHLEWGPLRSQAYYNSRDKDNVTIYFIVTTWSGKPKLQLIKRKGFDMDILMDQQLPRKFYMGFGNLKGVFALDDELIKWTKEQLNE